jgi:hypothetical protein
MSTYRPSEPPAWDPMPGGWPNPLPDPDGPAYQAMAGGYGAGDPRWEMGRQPYGPPQPGYEELGYAPEEPGYGAMDAPYDTMDPPYDEMDEADPEMDSEALDDRPEPNGGVAAAVIAAGIGCATLGFLVVAAAASPQVSQWLTFYTPTGPLSGKAIVSSVIYLVAWPNLHYRLRDKQVDLYKAFMVTILLVALGIIGTFPPFYQLFIRVR